MGDPIDPLYGDRESFADMITSYYTDREPESCFVADVDGKVVGYLLGCLDTKKAWNPEHIGLRHALLRGLWLRPGTAGFFFRSAADTVRDALAKSEKRTEPDLARHPAHTHFSVAAEARGLPLAPGLFRSFFKHAKERGCAGVHGEVFVENERAMALHKALGFETYGAAWPAPGMRTPQGGRMHVQLWVRRL